METVNGNNAVIHTLFFLKNRVGSIWSEEVRKNLATLGFKNTAISGILDLLEKEDLISQNEGFCCITNKGVDFLDTFVSISNFVS